MNAVKRLICLFSLLMFFQSCAGSKPETIEQRIQRKLAYYSDIAREKGTILIDRADVFGADSWDRLCFFSPYQAKENIGKVLKEDSSAKYDIHRYDLSELINEGKFLLLLTQADKLFPIFVERPIVDLPVTQVNKCLNYSLIKKLKFYSSNNKWNRQQGIYIEVISNDHPSK